MIGRWALIFAKMQASTLEPGYIISLRFFIINHPLIFQTPNCAWQQIELFYARIIPDLPNAIFNTRCAHTRFIVIFPLERLYFTCVYKRGREVGHALTASTHGTWMVQNGPHLGNKLSNICLATVTYWADWDVKPQQSTNKHVIM